MKMNAEFSHDHHGRIGLAPMIFKLNIILSTNSTGAAENIYASFVTGLNIYELNICMFIRKQNSMMSVIKYTHGFSFRCPTYLKTAMEGDGETAPHTYIEKVEII